MSKYPGPWFCAVSRIPYLHSLLTGKHHETVLRLHKKYGPVVRIAPNELAFSNSDAWKDIIGHKNNAEEFAKYRPQYRPGRSAYLPPDILCAGRDEHAALRRQLSHGFSDKSMRAQEPRIVQFVDLLIKRLHQWSDNGKTPLRMDSWYNFTTFDIIGDLAFGDSFGCLENSDYHEWVKCIFALARLGSYFQVEDYYPFLKRVVTRLIPNKTLERQDFHNKINRAKLQARIDAGPRDDLIEGVLKKKDEWNMSIERLESNSTLLVIAGSETTATVLSGVTYLLTANPQTLERLTKEVRSTFTSEDEITIESVGRLQYMLACLDEALRMYPPVAVGLPRVTPDDGAMVAGHFVPKGVSGQLPIGGQWKSTRFMCLDAYLLLDCGWRPSLGCVSFGRILQRPIQLSSRAIFGRSQVRQRQQKYFTALPSRPAKLYW